MGVHYENWTEDTVIHEADSVIHKILKQLTQTTKHCHKRKQLK